MSSPLELEASLSEWFSSCPGAIVAYSGGVDSAVVAYASQRFLNERAIAATADSPSLAREELSLAQELAEQIGIRHVLLSTNEVDDPAYRVNDAQRCFHCKTHLYSSIRSMQAVQEHGWWILSGTNRDDLGDYRPGLVAAQDHGVRSPLVELGIGKADVRSLAAHWQLRVADKPASPCLSSRLAYGLEVTSQRLQMVERAEALLKQKGFERFRVRLHAGDLARIEVALDDLPRFLDNDLRKSIIDALGQFGFKFVTLDLEGFSSGSLNKLIGIARR